MGHPFLLISEARLEGGDFYLGSKEYEEMVISSIRSCMDKLGFNNNDLILSGLSMGTFGAMYYASFLKPGNIIIGKPLLSLGNVAKNERIERPGGFPTSLDVLFKEYGSLNDDAVLEMNNRFWDRFDSADWSGVTFYISYMIEDDYDKDAYERLLLHMKAGSRIIGSGLHGRHNDDTRGIVNWFVKQYRKISDRIRTENEQR
jgi:accessory secretory protein Asp2